MAYVGHVDYSMQSHATGWAEADGTTTAVTVVVNGVETGCAPTTMERPDVAAAGFALRSGWIYHHDEPLLASDEVSFFFPDGTPLPLGPVADHSPRLRRLTVGLDPATMRGIELGPLDRPLLGRRHWKVDYVDHASREDLIAKYGTRRDGYLNIDRIVPTDIVWDGGGSLVEKLPSNLRYDFALASHVIEHVPDMVSWLLEITATLKEGGLINLAITDRDCTFDQYRVTTTAAEIVDDYVRKLTRPSARQIFDHVCNATPIGSDRQYNPVLALETVQQAERLQQYFDVHCRVFTNESFVAVFRSLADVALIPLELAAFFPTTIGNNEFIVSLRKNSIASPKIVAAGYADCGEQMASLRDRQAKAGHLGDVCWTAAN